MKEYRNIDAFDREIYMGTRAGKHKYIITKPGYRIRWISIDEYEVGRKEKLMYKVGDRVKIVDNYFADGRRSPVRDMIGMYGEIISVSEGARYPYAVQVDSGTIYSFMTHNSLELIKEGEGNMSKSITEAKVNDILVDEDGDFRKVLGVGKYGLELTSYHDNKDDAEDDNDFSSHYSFEEMEEDDWTFADEIKEVTLNEIARKFNVSVENIRVKE